MANVKISQLPSYTGNTSGSWLVMNNSGETTTYKVQKETFLSGFQPSGNYATTGSNRFVGNQTITGSLIASGSAGHLLVGGTTISGSVSIESTVPGGPKFIILRGTGSAGGGALVYNTSAGGTLSLYAVGTNPIIDLGNNVLGSDPTININKTNLSGSNNIYGNTTISGSLTVTGSIIQTGSVQGNVFPLSISSNTASLNLDNGNFFTLQLVSGSSTHLNPSNIKPGQTVSVFVNTTGSATMTFPSSIKQISGSAYVPTTSTGIDILTLISKDTSSLFLVNTKNLV